MTTLAGAVLALHLARDLGAEIALDRRNAAAVGDVADIGRLDAEHAMAAVLEIRKQRAVVRADVDDEIVAGRGRASPRSRAASSAKLSRSSLRRAAGVGIFRRKDDDRIDGEAELHQFAFAAMQQVGRKPRLLARHLADRHHLVDRRHVAEREHVIERRVSADLAAFDRDAGAGAGGARNFRGTQDVGLHCDVRFSARRAALLPVPVERRLAGLRSSGTRGL